MLLDLTEIPLNRLTELDDSVLAQSLRRLLEEVHEPDGTIARFDSSI